MTDETSHEHYFLIQQDDYHGKFHVTFEEQIINT